MKKIIKRILKEDINKKYLDKIVSYMFRHSNDGFPFDNSVMSFRTYCENEFGLTEEEIEYVYRKYRYNMGWDDFDSLNFLNLI
jgi:hypothetical protein